MNLQELRNLERAATPGPWHASNPTSIFQGTYVIAERFPSYGPGTPVTVEHQRANAKLLAALRNNAVELLDTAELNEKMIEHEAARGDRFRDERDEALARITQLETGRTRVGKALTKAWDEKEALVERCGLLETTLRDFVDAMDNDSGGTLKALDEARVVLADDTTTPT